MTRKFKLSMKYLGFIILLILFGIYKNSINPYIYKNVDLVGMIKPLVLTFMSLLGALLGVVLRNVKNIKNDFKKIISKNKTLFLETLLFVSIIPISSNPITVFLLTFIWTRFLYRLKLNNIALVGLTLIGLNFLLKSNIYQNSREMLLFNNYSTMDMFFGMNVGGLFATNICIILIAYFVLSLEKVYKKEIVFSAVLTFFVISIVASIFSGNYENILPGLYSHNILFIFVFILPDLNSSCYTRGGKVLSGVVAGALSYALVPLITYAAPLISVLFVSIFKEYIDKFFLKKSL